MRRVLWLTLGMSLACAGLGPTADGPAEEEPSNGEPTDVPGEEAPDDTDGSAALLVLDPAGGCTWRLHRIGGGKGRKVATTERCPERLWLAPDARQVVAQGEGWAWYGSPKALTAVPVDTSVGALWPAGGEPVLGRLDFGEEGTRAITYRLQGEGFEEAEVRPISDVDLMMGDLLSAPDDMDQGWVSLHAGEAPSKQEGDEEASDGAKKAVLEGHPDGAVGKIEVGGQLLLFRVEWGDTPHAFPPMAWCESAACEDVVALEGALPDQISAWPRGELVLIHQEYSGARPAVYRAGEGEPVWTGPEGSRAMWAPPR